MIIGNPGETYVMIESGVGAALRAASPFTSVEDRCKLTFFHDSQHFGFGLMPICRNFRAIINEFSFTARITELSPPLRPKPI